MKTKYVYITTVILCVFVLLVIFKLNSYYKDEKTQTISNQLQQQNLSLKTSISTQLGQLKNVLSSYSYRVDEAQINWVQMDPMTVLAQTHISKSGFFEVKNIFTKSGTKTERWTKEFLQKALSLRKYSGRAIHADLFQTATGDKYLSLSFVSGGNAVTVVGDANYFQRFFDLNRSQKMTHLLVTDAKTVAGHSISEYVATVTTEADLNGKKYLLQADELRASNFRVISYSAKNKVLSFLNIPLVLLGLILGFSCLLIGILFYAFRPIEKMIEQQKTSERQVIYKKALTESLKQNADAVSLPSADRPLRKLQLQIHAENKPESKPIEKPVAMLRTPLEQPVFASKATEEVKPDFKIDINSQKNISVVLAQALSSMKSKIEAGAVSIEQDLKSTNQFEFDPARFEKMFEHILNNALEAVRLSNIKNILVQSYDLGLSTVVEIADSGPGVPEDMIEKIWQPYFSTKEKSKHQGLGLSEALSIARRYEGELVMTHRQTGGALVKLTLGGEAMAKTKSEVVVEHIKDLDLDRLLSLDDDVSLENAVDLKKEFTTTQFKIDQQIQIIEEPKIEFQKMTRPMDEFKVQIRGPQKS